MATKRDDDALRFLKVDDIHDVFDGERLEIELIGEGIVGRDGLWVVVDDDSLIAFLLNRPNSVRGRIVELNALTDSDWA